jgi:hypothetical protein
VLCEGGLYSDALEVSQSRKRVDLISNIMSSLKLESEQTLSLLVEKRELAQKLCARIVVVREKRSQVFFCLFPCFRFEIRFEICAISWSYISRDSISSLIYFQIKFYKQIEDPPYPDPHTTLSPGQVGTGFEDMDHSDLYSDTTSLTATSHTSSSSRRSAKSAKGRKKAEMKKYSLKEGSRYEYFAIQEAFKGIMTFITQRSDMIRDMVNILLLQGLLEPGQKVVAAHREVVEVVNKSVNVIWPPPTSDVVEQEGEVEVEPVSYPPEKVKLSAVDLLQFSGC